MPTARALTPDQFTPTRFDSAAEKAQLANRLVAFIASGFPASKFSKPLYTGLSNMFGHIAHYDRDGFYAEWFATPADQTRWVDHVLSRRGSFAGDPTHTWCDVEEQVRSWLQART